MIRIPTHREPTHPGEMLLEEFLIPMGITQRELADKIHVPYQRVNEIINKRRGITPSTALRLAKLFRVSEDFWMNLQLRWDFSPPLSTPPGKQVRTGPLTKISKYCVGDILVSMSTAKRGPRVSRWKF